MVPGLVAALGGGLKGALGATVLGGVAGGLATGISARVAHRMGGNAALPYAGSMVGPSIWNSAAADLGRQADRDVSSTASHAEIANRATIAGRDREADRTLRMESLRSNERMHEKSLATQFAIAAMQSNQRAQEFSRMVEQDNYVQRQRNLPIWIRAIESVNPWNFNTSTPGIPMPPPPPEIR